MLQVGLVDRQVDALTAGLVARAPDAEALREAASIGADFREAFEAQLVAEPAPESEADRILREIGA